MLSDVGRNRSLKPAVFTMRLLLMILPYIPQFSLQEGPQEKLLCHVSTSHVYVLLCNWFV